MQVSTVINGCIRQHGTGSIRSQLTSQEVPYGQEMYCTVRATLPYGQCIYMQVQYCRKRSTRTYKFGVAVSTVLYMYVRAGGVLLSGKYMYSCFVVQCCRMESTVHVRAGIVLPYR
jgi:hypothetical protein